MKLYIKELKFRWRWRFRSHRPKSPIEIYNTKLIHKHGLNNCDLSGFVVKVKKGVQ